MKIKNVIFLLIFFLIQTWADGEDNFDSNFLNSFFEGSFIILDEKFEVNETRCMIMAVHYIDEKNKIYDKAIIYEEIEGGLVLQLIIEDKRIMNGQQISILDLASYKDLKGFSSRFNYPSDPVYNYGLEMDGHFGDTLYTSDAFYINWDNEIQKFVYFVINYNLL